MLSDEERQKRIEAARALGFDVKETNQQTFAEAAKVSFCVTPHGVEGAEDIAEIFFKGWLLARASGAPLKHLEMLGTGTLGGFALAIAASLGGDEDVREMDELMEMVDREPYEDRTDKAIELLQETITSLEGFKEAIPDLPDTLSDTQIEELHRMVFGDEED